MSVRNVANGCQSVQNVVLIWLSEKDDTETSGGVKTIKLSRKYRVDILSKKSFIRVKLLSLSESKFTLEILQN